MATQEEIENLLSILFTNMNNMDSIYYDMFINTTPMDVTLERYDEDGTLQTYILPNRAKDANYILQGSGSPVGVTNGNAGVLYLDIVNYDLYFKSVGTDSYGWIKSYTPSNFVPGVNYLEPNGNGSALTNLNATSVSSGTLGDEYLTSNVTKEGNTFNGNSQLIKIDEEGKLPAVDGSQLTNLVSSVSTASDVELASLSSNQFLMYNGAKWINSNTLGDYVIETGHFDVSTTWYRKYNSGWIEQGGLAYGNNIFPVEFSKIYTFLLTPAGSSSSSDYSSQAHSVTNTSFSYTNRSGATYYYAAGMYSHGWGTTNIIMAGLAPRSICYIPTVDKIAVANYSSNNVMLISSTGTVTNTITVGAYPVSVCYIPTVDKIAVANLSSNNVMLINSAGTVTNTITVGTSPVSICYIPTVDKIAVANSSSNNVMLISSTGTVTNTITVGTNPYSICYIPTVDKIAVANLSSNNVMFLKTI